MNQMTSKNGFPTVLLMFLWAGAALPADPVPVPAPVPVPVRGIVADPCAQVPLEPPAGAPSDGWFKQWLAMDWSQQCRYRAQNRSSVPATRERVVFIGDSITEGWQRTDPGYFNEQRINRGISGQTTAQMLLRFRADVIDLHPAVVHILAGTNDVAGNTGPEAADQLEANIESMIELAHAHHIKVLLGEIPPAARFGWAPELNPAPTIAQLNDKLRAWCARHPQYVDQFLDYHHALDDGRGGIPLTLSEDGVHPNGAGYARMRPIAEAAIAHALHSPSASKPKR